MSIQLCSEPSCRNDAKHQCVKCKFLYCLDHLWIYRADSFGIWYICDDCNLLMKAAK